jgi:hypothetical protein
MDALDVPTSPEGSGFIDDMVSEVVNTTLIKQAIRSVVAECTFCVTIADPRGEDTPLIAVSEAFESMTGFSRHEILGVNCRFLNHGCDISPEDLMGLRTSSRTGEPFTALLPNRRKSGEMFVNLLDLRGLRVAQDLQTGEYLWFLIGIQADVTDIMEDDEVPEDHLEMLQEVASRIRARLRNELSTLAASSAEKMERELSQYSCLSAGSGVSDRQASHSSGRSEASKSEIQAGGGMGGKTSKRFSLLPEPVWIAGYGSEALVNSTMSSRPTVRPMAGASIAEAAAQAAADEAASGSKPQLPPRGERAPAVADVGELALPSDGARAANFEAFMHGYRREGLPLRTGTTGQAGGKASGRVGAFLGLRLAGCIPMPLLLVAAGGVALGLLMQAARRR